MTTTIVNIMLLEVPRTLSMLAMVLAAVGGL